MEYQYASIVQYITVHYLKEKTWQLLKMYKLNIPNHCNALKSVGKQVASWSLDIVVILVQPRSIISASKSS